MDRVYGRSDLNVDKKFKNVAYGDKLYSQQCKRPSLFPPTPSFPPNLDASPSYNS